MVVHRTTRGRQILNDRKWLNLVIFLISVMIILFLILQKNMDRNTLSSSAPVGLIEDNFHTTMLTINGRWLPIQQLKKEIPPEQWQQFNNAWRTLSPITEIAASIEFPSTTETFELVWVGKQQKRSFKLFKNDEGLFIQAMNNTTSLYFYDLNQSKNLLPDWLINKTALKNKSTQ